MKVKSFTKIGNLTTQAIAVMMITVLLMAALPFTLAQASPAPRPLAAVGQRGTPTSATVLNNASLIINKPTGVVPDDVLIANLVQVNSLTPPTAPAGWTLIDTADLGGGTNRFAAVFYKVAGVAEPATYTFTVPTGATVRATGAIIAFSGVNITSGPFDVAPGTISVANNSPAGAASITTATNNAVVIMLGESAATAPTWSTWNTATSPGALTELYDVQGSTTTSIGAASATKSTAGATGAGSAVVTPSERNGAILLALRPETRTATTTTLSALSAITYGATASFTATVSPIPTTGSTVRFYNGATLLGSPTTNASGQATFTTTAGQLTTVGSPYSITAYFAGDATRAPSVSTSASQVVNPKALTAQGTLSGGGKVYDGTTAATPSGAAALQAAEAFGSGNTADGKPYTGDAVSLTGSATYTFNTKDVATATTITESGLSLTGGASGNYTLTPPTLSASITARALAVTATGVNRIYDGTTDATVTLGDNRVAGDLLTVGYTSASFADKNVANGKTVSVTGITVTGTDSGNYTFNTTTSTTANITARALAVTATGVNRIYDGTTDATVTFGDNRIAGDVLTVNYTSATFADKDVANGKIVTVSGISLSGTDSGNYTPNTSTIATANITARALTVTATGINKIYDGTTDATVTLGDDRVFGDLLTIGYTAATFADKNVADGIVVSVTGITVTGTDSGNYTFNTSTSTTANITKAAASCTITGFTGAYDAAAHGATGSCTGIGVEVPGTLDLGASFTNVPGGTAHWVFTGNGNYADQNGDVSITISQATPVLTVSNTPVTYNSAAQAAIVTASVPGSAPTNIQYNSSATTPINANTYAVTADFTPTDTTNYASLVGASAGNFVINKANAVCTVTAYNVPFDNTAHTATGSCVGVGTDGTLSGLDLTGTTHTDVGDYATDPWTFTAPNTNYNNASGTVHDVITAVVNNPVITDPAPTLVNMSVNGTPTAFALTLHATDADAGQTATLAWSISVAASHGTAATEAVAGGTNIISYTPATNYIGSDSFTVQVQDADLNTDTRVVNVAIGQEQLVVTSVAAQDGWVLESGETTGLGGLKNAKGLIFRLGDDALNRQYRGILSFDTTGIPDNAIVTQVVLKIQRSGAVKASNPFLKLGKLAVDIKLGNFGLPTLQLTDFRIRATKSAAFFIDNSATNIYSGTAGALSNSWINKAGNTQMRLRFTKDDNNNHAGNLMNFFSGNAATGKPELTIFYYIPAP